MFKHQLVGRVGLFVSVLVLASACTGGEISDVPGGARRGPEAGDPEAGNEVSPLVCPGASPDVSAQNGWQSSEASLPADGALRFELKARSTAANLDGLVAVGAEDIDEFAKAAIAVRFADDGLVDVRDGAFYSSDLAYPYDPGVWYSIAISADIDAETYDVEIGPCGEPRKTLIEDASFRDNANVSGQLSEWAVWSSQAAALEVSTPAWMNSEGCAPATCLSLRHTCGTPQDGCGGVLSCGVCGDGEMCSSGTCIAAPANPSPPPPPSCTPTTCQSLGTECGQWGDGCGGILSCGSCNGGQMCSGGVCIDVPPNAPPPPACTPTTCQSLGAECGQWGDGCGGILSCGGCSGGETCSIGVCVPPPPPACTPASCQSIGAECGPRSDGCGGVLSCGVCGDGEMCSSGTCIAAPANPSPPTPRALGTPYGHVVPADVGVTIGAGVIAATPTAPYTGPSTITADNTTIENVVISTCLALRADNITIRNVIIDCADWYTIDCETSDGSVVEYSTAHNSSGSGKGLRIRGCTNFTVRNNELSGGEDFVYGGGYPGANTLDNLRIENNYFHSMIGTASAHADGFQIDGDYSGNIYVTGNYFDPNNTQIGYTDLLFLNGTTPHNWYFENNYTKVFGYYTMRCGGSGVNCIIRNNIYAQEFKTELQAAGAPSAAALRGSGAPPAVYECNRYEDGNFIENTYLASITHDTTNCPSYP